MWRDAPTPRTTPSELLVFVPQQGDHYQSSFFNSLRRIFFSFRDFKDSRKPLKWRTTRAAHPIPFDTLHFSLDPFQSLARRTSSLHSDWLLAKWKMRSARAFLEYCRCFTCFSPLRSDPLRSVHSLLRSSFALCPSPSSFLLAPSLNTNTDIHVHCHKMPLRPPSHSNRQNRTEVDWAGDIALLLGKPGVAYNNAVFDDWVAIGAIHAFYGGVYIFADSSEGCREVGAPQTCTSTLFQPLCTR